MVSMPCRISPKLAREAPPKEPHGLRCHVARGGNASGWFWACTHCGERLIWRPQESYRNTKKPTLPTVTTYYHVPPCDYAVCDLDSHVPGAITDLPRSGPASRAKRIATPPYPWLDRPAVSQGADGTPPTMQGEQPLRGEATPQAKQAALTRAMYPRKAPPPPAPIGYPLPMPGAAAAASTEGYYQPMDAAFAARRAAAVDNHVDPWTGLSPAQLRAGPTSMTLPSKAPPPHLSRAPLTSSSPAPPQRRQKSPPKEDSIPDVRILYKIAYTREKLFYLEREAQKLQPPAPTAPTGPQDEHEWDVVPGSP